MNTIDNHFSAEHIRLLGIGLRAVFTAAKSPTSDEVRNAALRVAGIAAKQINDLITRAMPGAAMDITWHPAAPGSDLAGILQVQENTSGATMLQMVLECALQVLVAMIPADLDTSTIPAQDRADIYKAVNLLSDVCKAML